MGFGISAFVIGKLFACAAPPSGDEKWKMAFLVFGIMICILYVVCAVFLRYPKEGETLAGSSPKGGTREPAMDISSAKMVRKPAFWIYYVWSILLSGVGLVLVSQAGGIAQQAYSGISVGLIATLVGVISVMNGAGRVVFGALFDRKGFRLTMLLCIALFLISGALLLYGIHISSLSVIIPGFITGGFAYGAVTPTNSAIVSDFFGRTHYPQNLAVMNTVLLLASFSSVIAGKLYDGSHSYNSTILMIMLLSGAGLGLTVVLRRPVAEQASSIL